MGLVHKILGKKTFEERERQRIELLKQLLILQQILIKRPEDYAKKIANDFYFDSITVSRRDGSVVISSGDGNGKSVQKVLDTIYEKFPDANFLLIKEDGHYTIVYPDGDMTYVFNSSGEVSLIEAKVAARNLQQIINKYRLNRNKNKIIASRSEIWERQLR